MYGDDMDFIAKDRITCGLSGLLLMQSSIVIQEFGGEPIVPARECCLVAIIVICGHPAKVVVIHLCSMERRLALQDDVYYSDIIF